MFYKRRYFRDSQHINLTDSEKELGRTKLQAFMQAHPVRVGTETRQISQENSSNFLTSFKSMMLKPLPITLSALLLLGGGTTFAAEQALPNQALYPVKIQVNERVRAALTPTMEARVKWEARVAERRLEEAEQLARQNELKAEVKTQVESNFDEQAKLVQEKIMALKASGNIEAAVEVSNQFQASLQAHEAIFTKLESEQSDQQAVDTLIEKIKLNATFDVQKIDPVNVADPTVKDSIESQAEFKLAAFKQQTLATEAIAAAKQEIAASLKIQAEIKAKATLILGGAMNDFRRAEGEFNRGEFKLALENFTQARIQAEEAKALVNTSGTVQIKTPNLPNLIVPDFTKEETSTSLETDPKAALDAQTQKQELETVDKAKLDLGL
jgi:tetratricopeptide (TPR) repeat protein